MMIKSKLTGKEYEPSNSTVLWLRNCQQVATYLYHDEDIFDDLLDVITTKKDGKLELVWVFSKTSRLKELYKMWNEHSFSTYK
jgi:hypothetical protein